VLRTWNRDREAVEVIETALDAGVTYFDSAAAYAGSQSYYGQVWRRRSRERVFQASKSAGRTRDQAWSDLENTLEVMGLEYLDLWQIHDVRTDAEIEQIAGPGGALEAFQAARERGLVRHIGVTAHHDPDVLTEAIHRLPVDAVMLPVNPAEAALGGFLDGALPAARSKGLAVIGMKVLGGGNYVRPEAGATPEKLIRFALTQDVDVVIAGCKNAAEVRLLSELGGEEEPGQGFDGQALVDLFRPQARQLAYYRKR
jgi:predicted aldo/keto reductase-like oxidoreductase